MLSEPVVPPGDTRSGRFGILMSDIRGFTSLTEQHSIQSFIPLLDRYFEQMTLIIDHHGGRVDKFMGDSVLALFDLEGEADAGYRMLSCAVDMQIAMDAINAFGKTLDLPEVFMGIGIDAGDIIGCTLGSAVYRAYTILGEPVNTASRMSTIALRGQILISHVVFEAWSDQLESGSDFNLLVKGKQRVIRVHELLGVLNPENKTVPRRENRRHARVEAFLPASYHLVENKRIMPQAIKAEITDLSYGGMRIFTTHHHQLLDEIKILVPFALGEERISEVYAKVLSSTALDERNNFISVEFSFLDEFARKSIRSLVDRLV